MSNIRCPSRRRLLAGAVASLVQWPVMASAQPADDIIEEWMEKWMSDVRATHGALHLSRFVEPWYFLLKPTVWLPDPGQGSRLPRVTVPTGFVTDFASIPRLFWTSLRPDGEYTHPAVVHDYLYWTQTTSREAADEIFRIMMGEFSIGTGTAEVVYRAVRFAAGTAWDNNTKARAAGEKRVLKRFPDDPRTRWKDWKEHPEFFQD